VPFGDRGQFASVGAVLRHVTLRPSASYV
jgi:hypothetical protein